MGCRRDQRTELRLCTVPQRKALSHELCFLHLGLQILLPQQQLLQQIYPTATGTSTSAGLYTFGMSYT
jgi:hypothetical protein